MQQRRNITCLQLKTHKNYYLSTARYKEELFPVYNKQQIGNITCRQQTTKKNYYLPTTNNKTELLPVHNTQLLVADR
jgi:hypothetical protein